MTKIIGHGSPLSPAKVFNDFCHQPSVEGCALSLLSVVLDWVRNGCFIDQQLRACVSDATQLTEPSLATFGFGAFEEKEVFRTRWGSYTTILQHNCPVLASYR